MPVRRRGVSSGGRRLQVESLESRLVLSVAPVADLPFAIQSTDDASGAAWMDLDRGDQLSAGEKPQVAVLESSAERLAGSVSLPGLWVDSSVRADRPFVELTIPDAGSTTDVGLPQIPVLRYELTVPAGATVHASLEATPQTVTLAALGLDDPLLPTQPPLSKNADPTQAGLTIDEAAYQTDSFSPIGVQVVDAGYRDGQRVVLLEMRPVAYNPGEESLLVCRKFTFQVDVDAAKGADGSVSTVSGVPLALSTGVSTASSSKGVGGRLLIVAHDSFLVDGTVLDEYVAHKMALGWTVDVAGTSTAGATAADIKAYIQSRYDDPQTRPDALLLVGDTPQIPAFLGKSGAVPTTDLYYSTMDSGDDWLPEFPVGRFSVTTMADLTAVVDKTIAYENTLPEEAWTHKAAFISSADSNYWPVTEATHEWSIGNYLDPREYASDRLYPHSNHATTQSIRNALNDGRALAVYSGHGSAYSWADAASFSQTDIRNLSASGAYPFVASFACQTGSYEETECFGETWLRQAGKGAVAMLGSTEDTYWEQDDILQKSLFTAIYDGNETTFGNAVLTAKQLYLADYGTSDMTRRYFEMYNLLGDPTVALAGVSLNVLTPSTLPNAHPGEPYEYYLSAGNGEGSYTWSVTQGSLPDQLTLQPETGLISGTPSTAADSTFTVTVEDSLGRTASQEIRLGVIEPLLMTTSPQLVAGTVGADYSVTLQAAGGTDPLVWSLPVDYHETAQGGPLLGGGTAKTWNADDRSWLWTLPFNFPFFGQNRASAYVSSNGYIDFTSSSADYRNSTAALLAHPRIAGLWDDLTTVTGDIEILTEADYAAVRWYGSHVNGQPVDFEIELFRDGRIEFHYATDHYDLTPTVGISAGDGVRYNIASIDSSDWIAEGTSISFTPPGSLPPGLTWDPALHTLSGRPTTAGTYQFDVEVRDSSPTPEADRVNFSMHVTDLPPMQLSLPEKVWEGERQPSLGTISLAEPQAEDLTVMLASGDPSQLEVPFEVVVPAGQTSVTFPLSPVDDDQADGVQTVAVTVSADAMPADTAMVLVGDNEVDHFDVQIAGTNHVAGLPFAVTVTAADVHGDPIAVLSGPFEFSAVGDHGSVALQWVSGPTTLSGGSWTGEVVLASSDTGVAVSVGDGLGHVGQSLPMAVAPPPAGPTLDLDGNGVASVATDGVILLRYLLDFRGQNLVRGKLAPDAQRTDPDQIVAYLNGAKSTMLDVDGDGLVSGFMDGIAVLRYLSDFQGDSLVKGVIGRNAQRTTPAAIAGFLDSWMPGSLAKSTPAAPASPKAAADSVLAAEADWFDPTGRLGTSRMRLRRI
jgi:hypothetical protein